jgi:hypothetical protein
MRPNLTIVFLIFITISSLKPWTNPIYITGHLKSNHIDTAIHLEKLYLVVKGDKKVLAKTKILKSGKFEMSFTPRTEVSFDFYCVGIGVDTIMIASVTSFVSDTPDVTFYLPARTKKNTAGQVVCLKCNKSDKIYSISYSDHQPITKNYLNSAGAIMQSIAVNKDFTNDRNYYKLATKYCDRDKVEF